MILALWELQKKNIAQNIEPTESETGSLKNSF